MSDTIGSGQFRYFSFPFTTRGVTIRVDVFSGGIWCYASDTERNPSRLSYTWRLFISEYDDTFIDPGTLGRTPGQFLFVALEGVDSANNFTLDSTEGDTSIAGNSYYARIIKLMI